MGKVLIPKYIVEEKFIIPNNIDLDNKEQVECYWVKYNVLHIMLKGEQDVLEVKGEGYVEVYDFEHPSEEPVLQDDSDDEGELDDEEEEGDDEEQGGDNDKGEGDKGEEDNDKDEKVKNVRKVIIAKYTIREKFIIPDHIDLENKKQVSDYAIHYNVLQVFLKGGKKIDIKGEGWVEDFDYKYPDEEPRPQYDEDEDEDDELSDDDEDYDEDEEDYGDNECDKNNEGNSECNSNSNKSTKIYQEIKKTISVQKKK